MILSLGIFLRDLNKQKNTSTLKLLGFHAKILLVLTHDSRCPQRCGVIQREAEMKSITWVIGCRIHEIYWRPNQQLLSHLKTIPKILRHPGYISWGPSPEFWFPGFCSAFVWNARNGNPMFNRSDRD